MKDDVVNRVRHATITLERTYPVTPERAFRAFADAEERRKWDTPGDGWETTEFEQDMREDGRETFRFGPKGDPRYHGHGFFADVQPNRRLVSAGVMKDNGEAISATVATYEFLPDPEGVRLTITDQTAYFGEADDPEGRRSGWTSILDNLGGHLG